jgi:flagellar biosynthesis chaperone FliJ
MINKEKIYQQIIMDLEAIIAWQNSYIWTLERSIDAYIYRMWWYNDFINDYDAQLLEVSKNIKKSKKIPNNKKKDIVKKVKKIKGKIRELLPKENRRYGRNKTK